ncbi:WXG100 family type VII secretion target [Nocardiopsis trehalosi]|jgi:uncharacterized protein YukE|uniref:hypothetical protein n=1 Tax=Nocardiopsis trehalosi TaxID=109329 RepID=UPI00082D44D4|nr:hypothetical protein [Nocardiopsis trehalosi]
MSGLTISTQEANNQAMAAMEETHTKCQGSYNNVDSIRDGLRGGWAGDASTIYQEAMVKWLEELRLLINDMNSKIGEWGGTSTAMINVEDQNLVASSRWMSDLNPNN